LTHRLFIPLLSAIISAPYSTDNRDNNPTLPELLHESINQGIDRRLTFAGGVADCACPLSTVFLDVMNNIYEFPSFVKEQRQHQRSVAT
jgi:hypothetical protein